jgi:uncharacterized membrane protein
MKTLPSYAQRITAPRRLAYAVAAALAVFALQTAVVGSGSRFLPSWDVGASVYLALAWATILQSDAAETRLHARSQDMAAFVIFVLVLIAAFASMATITLLLEGVKELAPAAKAVHIFLSVIALVSSWLLIHTIYTFHYARRFYAVPERGDEDDERGGLDFPGTDGPDYFDFAYYSFVVGMTSQVSDVSISSHHMRRTTLLHSVLSFAFNIAVLALSVNILVSVI